MSNVPLMGQDSSRFNCLKAMSWRRSSFMHTLPGALPAATHCLQDDGTLSTSDARYSPLVAVATMLVSISVARIFASQSLTDTSSFTPEIVILDLNLPKISGMQLLKEIKSNSQTASLPVLILTNSISKKEMTEAYRLGASGFIQKSIDFEEYREAIETLVMYWSKVVALPSK